MTGVDAGADAESTPERVESVVVVGGGDAGLITALLLRRRNPDLPITVVDDFEQPVPEVGKSTITYILHSFHEVLGIDKQRFVSAVKPVWKASVAFEDWCGRPAFHVPFDDAHLVPPTPSEERFEELRYRYETQSYATRGTELADQRKTPFVRAEDGSLRTYEQVAYHLGTNRLNAFLREVAEERGIDLVDDEITAVHADGARISLLESERSVYEADLYVDATGFARRLVGELPNAFEPFDFPLDSALVAKVPLDLADVVPATVIRTGDYGWFWQIDTYDWRDLGYVYASDFVSREDATAEFVARHDGAFDASDVSHFSFDSGTHEAAWVGNCVAVGNALGFVEPLQSTALTLNAIATEKLADLLADHHRIAHDGVRDVYNEYARRLWGNVYDFVSLHYKHAPGEGDFWDAMRAVNRRDTLAEYVETYRRHGFGALEEFDDARGRMVFTQFIFYRVLRSLGVRSDFYESIDAPVPPEVASAVEERDAAVRDEVARHLTYEELYGLTVFD